MALVDARGGAASQRGALIARVATLLVHGVSSFVHGGEQRLGQEILLHAGGDAHVADGELGRKRMRRFVLATPLKVVAKSSDDVQAKFPLLGFREVPAQAGVVRRGLGGDGLHDGHQLLA